MELPVSLTAAPPSEVVGTSAGSKEGEGQVRGEVVASDWSGAAMTSPLTGPSPSFVPALVPTTSLGAAAVNLWVQNTSCHPPEFLYSVLARSSVSLPETPFSRSLRSTICIPGHPHPMRSLWITNGGPERAKKRCVGERKWGDRANTESANPVKVLEYVTNGLYFH